MPTYTVRTSTGRLGPDARASLAHAMTSAHTAATGAPGFFAQVVFEEVDTDRHFVGGTPITDELVFVHGQIRAGRTPEQKAALLDALGGAVREVLGVPRRTIWVYLVDLPPANMIEYGHVLPAAGEEAEWLASLDDDTRGYLASD